MSGDFSAAFYQGKPAVYDLKSHVVYTGYKNMTAAVKHANELNDGARKEKAK
jgi:hypothetical protein